jgi:hypothetical protein
MSDMKKYFIGMNSDFEDMDEGPSEPLYDIVYNMHMAPTTTMSTPKTQRRYSQSMTNPSQESELKSDYRNQSNLLRYKKDQQLYKDMIQLNIKQDKIQKALNATAYESKTEAINWLIRHNKDSILNSEYTSPTREFMVLMCPVGRLANQIEMFLSESLMKVGPNEAHFNNRLPYMKLTPFFKVRHFLQSTADH